MELRQLEHFLAVADEGHFTRAAARCHIAQSALSSSVRSLERDLGTPLFRRSTRRVSLTDAGRTFVPHARRVLDNVSSARNAVVDVMGVQRGTLVLGTVVSAHRWFDLPALLARFSKRHPAVELHLKTAGADVLVAGVAEGVFDIALVGLSAALPKGLASYPLVSSRYVFVCSSEHRLAGRSRVSVEELDSEAFIDLGRGTVVRQVTDRVFAERGQVRSVRFEVHDVDTALELVSFGLGSIVLPETPEPAPEGVVFVPVTRWKDPWTLALVTVDPDSEPNPAAQAMLDVATADRSALRRS
jgi:DNA-binding transcriptional LysR family regulator